MDINNSCYRWQTHSVPYLIHRIKFLKTSSVDSKEACHNYKQMDWACLMNKLNVINSSCSLTDTCLSSRAPSLVVLKNQFSRLKRYSIDFCFDILSILNYDDKFISNSIGWCDRWHFLRWLTSIHDWKTYPFFFEMLSCSLQQRCPSCKVFFYVEICQMILLIVILGTLQVISKFLFVFE